MAKLQTLKQNTDPSDTRDEFSGATANSKFTSGQPSAPSICCNLYDMNTGKSSASGHRSDDANRHGSSSCSTPNILPPPSTPEARSADILSHISERHNSYR